jgi:predicted permease
LRVVTPGWFAAMGIPIVAGRDILPSDTLESEPVVVVNRAFAKKFYPDVPNVLERRIKVGDIGKEKFPFARIVGVIGDVRGYGLDEPYRPETYWPLAQHREPSTMAIVARATGDPRPLLNLARAAIADLDATQPIFDLQPADELLSRWMSPRRFVVTLMLLFALVALALAAVGIYAVIAYNVAQRTQEIGIRVALGAQPRAVLAMVVRDGMKLVAVGLLLGGTAALGLARVTASLLYGISATDVGTHAFISATLALIGFVAVVVPARRAMRIDPIEALRTE